MKLVECVPNFSEGRDRQIIDAIAARIASVDAIRLLDVDPGADTNRTVVTFVGEPEAVLEAAFRGVQAASELIDMRKHQGAHPRMGACDVCPFVPVRNVAMDECVALARGLGERVASELDLPVYLYEEAASRPDRKNLAKVRAGEYEGLETKLANPAWAPDFGPAAWRPRFGALIIGARQFLIAYNFNLNTEDVSIANRIAWAIREKGHQGVAGKFPHVKAVGWHLPAQRLAQVSMNLTDYQKTPLAEVFDEVCRQAGTMGVRVTGSELVGLIPEECLLQAGRHFLKQAGKISGASREELIRMAVHTLGLSELAPFRPQDKIVEQRIREPRPLLDASLRSFVESTASEAPAPGGGSVSALLSALAAALPAMVARLTFAKIGLEDRRGAMEEIALKAHQLKDQLLDLIDEDTWAYQAVLAAYRLPKKTEQDKQLRKQAIQQANRRATEVPLSVLGHCAALLPLVAGAIEQGMQASLSDAAVAGHCLRAAAEGAFANVRINLPGLKDEQFVANTTSKAQGLIETVRKETGRLATLAEAGIA